MNKEEYNASLQETTRITGEIIEGILLPFRKNPELHNSLSIIPQRRKHIPSVRPYLLRKSYEVVGGTNWLDIAQVAAATDLLMDGIYYANAVYDDKSLAGVELNVKKAVNASAISRALATKLVLQWSRVNDQNQRHLENILSAFNESDITTETGQYTDVNDNILDGHRNEPFNIMRERYLQRTAMINATFLGNICKTGAILGNATTEQINALETFGFNYGMALQIINDLGDYVPGRNATAEKEGDSFSDLKHRKLTLPLIYALHNYSDPISLAASVQVADCLGPCHLECITRILIECGAVDYVRKTAKRYAALAKDALRIFPKQERRELSTMLVVASSNKYYAALRNTKNKLSAAELTKSGIQGLSDLIVETSLYDEVLGVIPKLKAHEGDGVFHRAIAVVIKTPDGKYTLAKRSDQKLLWPGYYDLTIASHPRPGETYQKAAERRCIEELGVTASVRPLGVFSYFAKYGNYAENELCRVFAAEVQKESIRSNPKEISNVVFEDKEGVLRYSREGSLTPWANIILNAGYLELL